MSRVRLAFSLLRLNLCYTFFLHVRKNEEVRAQSCGEKRERFFTHEKSDQLLTTTDRLIYIYVIDTKTNKTIEVVNVSYEIKIEGDWQTIIHYDSAHGYLHKHSRVSLDDEKETTTRESVKRKGDPKRWLTWAIQDIQSNFLEYRRLFFKRSKITDSFY
jgi:hypothetical protein